MAGLYKIRLQWDRISKELKLGRPKKDIYKELNKDGLYPYRYESFIRILKKELEERARLASPSTSTEEIPKASEPSKPSIKKGEEFKSFSKRNVAKDVAEIADAENKFLTK